MCTLIGQRIDRRGEGEARAFESVLLSTATTRRRVLSRMTRARLQGSQNHRVVAVVRGKGRLAEPCRKWRGGGRRLGWDNWAEGMGNPGVGGGWRGRSRRRRCSRTLHATRRVPGHQFWRPNVGGRTDWRYNTLQAVDWRVFASASCYTSTLYYAFSIYRNIYRQYSTHTFTTKICSASSSPNCT